MDMKLELVPVPVTDVNRAKAFYERVGFVADHDHTLGDHVRFVQLTPPGSACSIVVGTGITTSPPGSAQGMLLVVTDIEEAHAELVRRGVEISPFGTNSGVRATPTSPTPTATPGSCSSPVPSTSRATSAPRD
jgi:predicted enzyme related to lactoylglutathione lyase